jgi:FKBP-type peptidyl-prolyl cis-trans isomerase
MRWYLLLAALLTMGVACGQPEVLPDSGTVKTVAPTAIPTSGPTPVATPAPTGVTSGLEQPDVSGETTGASQGASATQSPEARPAATEVVLQNDGQSETPQKSNEVKMDALTTTPSGLQYRDLTVGEGTAASQGDTAVVHYTGWLLDGTKFDSSVDRGTPFEFPLGAGRVIGGWDEGVGSMNVGGKRELIIPPDLAYGDRGAGGVIPPGATLKFEVELLDLK